MDTFQEFIVKSKYCRWDESLGRRETWAECVDRYYSYIEDRFGLTGELNSLRRATQDLEVFPSMRALMTSGAPADVDNVCMYNCAYLPINSIRSFSDVMYILCCTTGVGFSCEEYEISQLPEIPEEIERVHDEIVKVPDSRAGWSDSFRFLLSSLYSGRHITWDTSLIRPKGARLKTFGGRASGPEPLEKLFRYVVQVFNRAKGRRLTSLEVHDIVCMIGEIVISGGVRRSALISLSDLHDREMANAKSGAWWEGSGHRSLSNNSAVYNHKPSLSQFLEEWLSLYNSKSGERGLCNRESLIMLAKKSGRDTEGIRFGTNPCSEIILRPKQFCNLTEVVIRNDDNLESLSRKVKFATILGTIQSACTDFPYLDGDWKQNCEEERLLGVSFTGVFDNRLMSGQAGIPKLRWTLEKLKEVAQHTNLVWASRLGISPSKAITCCKPSGTTSCVAGTSSGMHPRYASSYIRRARIDITDPICQFMIDKGIPHEPCSMNSDKTMVFSFPIQAPDGCITQADLDPIQHMNLWLEYQKSWCDHKPSITISYTDTSFLEIGQWVWDNWDYVSGMSFLPFDENIYEQAPFEAISKTEYERLSLNMPTSIDWMELGQYETEDMTKGSRELSCHGGSCEIIDMENIHATRL